MKKFTMCVAVLFLVVGVLLGVSKDADKTVAVVNGEPIFESEINTIFVLMLNEYKRITPVSEQTKEKENELWKMILEEKVSEVVLRQEATKQNIKPSRSDVQKNISEVKKRFANDSEFAAQLERENMTMSDLEKKISEQIAIQKLLKQSVESKVQMPTEIEIRSLYDKIIAKIKGVKAELPGEEDALISNLATGLKRMSGEQVRVRQIFISLPKNANADVVKVAQSKVATIKKELQTQAFADVAGQYSEDPVSKARNGDLGMVARGDLLPALDNVAFSMKVGKHTNEPIKTDIGLFFLRVEERRAEKNITFDDVKNDLTEFLIRVNASKVQSEYVGTLKSKSNITINKPSASV